VPEIWIPYGDTETLITLGAENLGELIEPAQDSLAEEELERLERAMTDFQDIVVCDYKPSTIEVLKRLLGTPNESEGKRLFAKEPKQVEARIPELKWKVEGPGRTGMIGKEMEIELSAPLHLTEGRAKLVISTAEPDPLFGLVDSRLAICLSYVTNAREFGYKSRSSDEPAPFSQTPSAEAVMRISEHFPNLTPVTVVPRGSRPHRVLRDAPFDAVKNSFIEISATPTRAAIIGIGGEGYDETLSDALRLIWGSLSCVRAGGEILLISECGEGLGSKALEMLIEGRIDEEGGKKKESYIDGIEELQYLKKLKRTYDIILMSGLPELYAHTKLGFSTARGSGEGVEKLLARLGRTTKVNVVTRACECSLAEG